MSRTNLLRSVAVAILCTGTFYPPTVQAETETWQIQSTYPYKVQVEFYSIDRKGLSWPGSGKAFHLDDSNMHSFKLNCNPGERICYGAWNVATGGTTGSRYWGVGQNSKYSCKDCCWTCGRKGEPRSINLTR
jgi:hypothetical protein